MILQCLYILVLHSRIYCYYLSQDKMGCFQFGLLSVYETFDKSKLLFKEKPTVGVLTAFENDKQTSLRSNKYRNEQHLRSLNPFIINSLK